MKIKIPIEVEKSILSIKSNKTVKNSAIKIYSALYMKSYLKNSNGYFPISSEYLKSINLRYYNILNHFIETGIIDFYKKAYQDEKDINIIVDLVQQKLKQHINVVHNSNFSPKWLENLVDINRKWDIDCLAFCIDPRYIEIDGDQSRLAVSYGINYTEIRQGILAPSSQKGKTVFGIHNVVIQNGYKLNLCDKWIDSIEGENFDTLQEAVKKGFQILSEINNEEYLRLVDFYGEKGAFGVSQRYFLDEFDIHTDIG